MRLHPADLFLASIPTVASVTARTLAGLTLSEWKDVASIAGAVLGGAYLLWKWRREAKQGKRPTP